MEIVLYAREPALLGKARGWTATVCVAPLMKNRVPLKARVHASPLALRQRHPSLGLGRGVVEALGLDDPALAGGQLDVGGELVQRGLRDAVPLRK